MYPSDVNISFSPHIYLKSIFVPSEHWTSCCRLVKSLLNLTILPMKWKPYIKTTLSIVIGYLKICLSIIQWKCLPVSHFNQSRDINKETTEAAYETGKAAQGIAQLVYRCSSISLTKPTTCVWKVRKFFNFLMSLKLKICYSPYSFFTRQNVSTPF